MTEIRRSTLYDMGGLDPETPPTQPRLRIAPITMAQLDVIRSLNYAIFSERRIINTFNRDDLLMLVAWMDEEPVGFKVGYRESRHTFYSAKGGVLPAYRRLGIARRLLQAMMETVQEQGFRRFVYDTFPNKHPGMTVLGLAEGFTVTRADYNAVYKDYRLRFTKEL